MNWELYEVWSVDVDGHEDLIDTTKSLKEAREMAENSLDGFIIECIIYAEQDGDLKEIERIQS
jgi:TPP-dependent pyruvate/acetoin dehydrogenase alpha subunit